MNQSETARAFTVLHVPGDPVILFNAWDPGSAKAIADAGAKAIATGSWSVAAAHGFADAEGLPMEIALANAARIADAVDLPVTLDFEGGYAVEPERVAANFGRVLEAGAIGCNFEDQVVGGEGLHPLRDHARRIEALRRKAEAAGIPAFINARTDIFLKAKADAHDRQAVDQALERARAYADAGASGFFVPGLADERLLARVCEGSPLPVNAMMFPGMPHKKRLAELGVARISHGPGPYRQAMAALTELARTAFA
ncbi:isocitrate lyase/phosphoenolpyruvate mutase family protein [Sphingomonas sp. MAH-20]|uniref:Isocitrate lyase/phosphoenolpyruvate mutase family protein n=1 Tax=Sphingomonas horti TaxID=2682842 RepID=A0A6I4J434_9SPHN|nr:MULTISPECIES: isocitrate lyase/phosphoenolpyruvate mutase family protein [Sphingomonas]MBA2921198.1 isocitrate lyase/phosphoenolpyruvate mutase family protein [Sphingomonas sp. CGMCC 1.13658]MVO79439.1 isocitrate lyase/phosphoenolpyruvate mutase family protein [Sphingomonas horti]